jgi:hypothetical protein
MTKHEAWTVVITVGTSRSSQRLSSFAYPQQEVHHANVLPLQI